MISVYILRLFVAMLVCLPVYLLIRRPWRFSCRREIVLGVFVLFMAALLFLTLQGTYGMPKDAIEYARWRIQNWQAYGVNLIPFRTICSIFKYGSIDQIMINLVANVLMFVPWGFGLPLLWKKFQSVWAVMAASLLITVFIETWQLFIGRSVDVDDIILNFFGGCIGGVLYSPTRKLAPDIEKLAE